MTDEHTCALGETPNVSLWPPADISKVLSDRIVT